MKLTDRRLLHLIHSAALAACAIAYLLAIAYPGYAAEPSRKAYTPFDEPRPRTPQEIVADKRLDVKVKVCCKSRNLKEIFADLSAKTGVKITTAREVSSQRPIAYFHDRSLRDVMMEVSGLYGYHWLISGKEGAYQYEIFEDTRHANRREELRGRIRAEMNDLMLSFAEKMLAGGAEADEALASIRQTNPAAYSAMSGRRSDADLLGGLGMDVLSAALREGNASRRCGELPADMQTTVCDWYNQRASVPATLMALDSKGQQVPDFKVPTPQPCTPAQMADATIQVDRVSPDQCGLPRLDLGVTVADGGRASSFKTQWPDARLTADDLRAATGEPIPEKVIGDVAISNDSKITISKLRWLPYCKGLLLGDVLEGIAARMGRDVIADSYLQDKSTGAITAQSLKQVVENVCRHFDYTCEVVGDTLRFRQNKWYTQDMHADPPAQVLEGLWTKIQQNGTLSVRDLLPVASLADEQIRWPGWKFIPGATAASESPSAVRLWASLTDDQEKTARDTGLAVAQMRTDQRGKVSDLVAERGASLTSEDIDAAILSVNTAKAEGITRDDGTKMVRVGSTSPTQGASPPVIPPGQTSGGPIRVVTTSGVPGGISRLLSAAGNGDAMHILSRMANSVSETLTVLPTQGKQTVSASLSLPQPISEAERKEATDQRKADAAAEIVELIP